MFGTYKRQLREKRATSRLSHLTEESKSIFQITEYNGELYFTIGTTKFCPCSMLKDEPIKALEKIRKLYIERNQNKDSDDLLHGQRV